MLDRHRLATFLRLRDLGLRHVPNAATCEEPAVATTRRAGIARVKKIQQGSDDGRRSTVEGRREQGERAIRRVLDERPRKTLHGPLEPVMKTN